MAIQAAANSGTNTKPKPVVWTSSLWAIIGGLVVLAFVAGFAIFHYPAANDATNVITAVGSVLGALVGAFFGVHTGVSAGTQAQQNALNTVTASHQQALDSMEQQKEKWVRMAVSVTPGSAEANQILDSLK